MKPTRMADNNVILGADQVGVRPIMGTRWTHEDGYTVISVGFELEPEDLEAIQSGAPIILDIVGGTIPPINLRMGTKDV